MKVSLVGAGPGDPGLLTIRGRQLLRQADVVVYDALANEELLALARPEARLVYVGKIAGRHALPQAEINALLVELAKEGPGRHVVRLKGGDPYIFGRGGEEAEYLRDHGVPFEEVPGISSAIAAPAYAGIPLTHRDLTSSVTILTGHENPEKTASAHNWQALARSGSTLVIVMGMKNLPHIVAKLLEAGMDPATPAALIYRGATPMQRSLTAALKDLPQAAEAGKFTNPSVIVVGKVAALHDKLDWFSQKPLLGRRIVVTRAREQASDLAAALAELGAQVIQCPSLEICPMPEYAAADAAIANLRQYQWLIFTSVNGVACFWDRLAAAGLDSRALGQAKVAAIGPATAQALADRGIRADLLPETYVAEAVADALLQSGDLRGSRILLPRAARARMALPDRLAQAGALVDVVPVYETRPGQGCAGEARELLESGKLDCVTFGSSSTVANFLRIIPADLLRDHPEVLLAPIGPITADTLRQNGLEPGLQPENFTIPGLVRAIAQYYSRQKATR